MELDELYVLKSNLEDRIENFFGDEPSPHYGDRGYQELLEDLSDINERIDELEK